MRLNYLTTVLPVLQDPPFTAKQYLEENPASVVEIMYTEDPVVGSEKLTTESTPLLIPEWCFSAGEPADWNPNVALEVSQDYVTLSTIDAVPSAQKGNEYVYKHSAECRGLDNVPKEGGGPQAAVTPDCSSTATCGMDILNRSYLLTAESNRDISLEPGPAGASGDSHKLYTNMDGPSYHATNTMG